MRLGFDAWGLSGDLYFTGMGQYAARLLRQIPRLAPDLSVVAYGAPGEDRPTWLPPAIDWRPVGRRLPAKLTALGSRIFALPRTIRRDRIDVFHSPAVHLRPFFPPVPDTHCPLVVTLHDLIPMTYYDIATLPLRQRLFYRWNLRRASRADELVTVSGWAGDEIARELGRPRQTVRVIYNGVDFTPKEDAAVLERLGVRGPYILYAGSYEPRKNLIGALAAFGALVDGGTQHRLVAIVERQSGHSPAAAAVLKREQLEEHVTFVHSLTDDDLRALYTGAAAFVFPSLAEGFGFPPIQAAACGVPVVASDLPVLRETLGDAAIFVDPRDPLAIAAGLRQALTDPSVSARLRAIGPARACHYREDTMAQRHIDLYRAVAR